MARQQVSIATDDGVCPATVFTPDHDGKWPAVLFFMDGLAIRPPLLDMGERLAKAGYVVLLPDMFYRIGAYEPLDPKKVFAEPDIRKALGPMMGSTDNKRAAKDAGHFLAYLDTRSDVEGRKVGAVGYCMGGAITLTVAGTYPDRVAVAASFHGGNLASDSELSPHRLASAMKGFVYIGVADRDNSYPPEMGERLENALRDAGVRYRCELYPNALHGWTQTDFPVYDAQAAEWHWRVMLDLFEKALKQPAA